MKMQYNEATANINMLFERDPANVKIYVAVLEQCVDRTDELSAAEFAESLRTNIEQIQSGASIVSTLIRRGGLERTILVDGQPYEGSLEALQSDDNVPDDAVIESFVQTTDAGIDMAANYRDSTQAKALYAELPDFAPGFKLVLAECASPEGKSTGELQDALVAAGIIGPGLSQAQVIHASFFTGKLESYGLLEWGNKRWHTTVSGKEGL